MASAPITTGRNTVAQSVRARKATPEIPFMTIVLCRKGGKLSIARTAPAAENSTEATGLKTNTLMAAYGATITTWGNPRTTIAVSAKGGASDGEKERR